MEWAQSVRPHDKSVPNLHHHLTSHSALTSLEHGLSKWLLIGGAAALGVMLVPVILPSLGVGGGVAAFLTEECCALIGTDVGLAGGIASAIESLPVIGTYLVNNGTVNVFAPAVAMLGGHAAGNLISQYEARAGKKDTIGSLVRITGMAIGVTLALPILLPALGHGVHFLGRLAGADAFGLAAAQFLGNTSACVTTATGTGIVGGTATLAAHLPCAIPAITASFPLLAPAVAKMPGDKKLAANDPNHFLTDTQQDWVNAYNQATADSKRALQSLFRARGFDPDFHADGTMHLYKHPHAMARG